MLGPQPPSCCHVKPSSLKRKLRARRYVVCGRVGSDLSSTVNNPDIDCECSHIRQVDGQLDRLELAKPLSLSPSPELHSASDGTRGSPEADEPQADPDPVRLVKLQVAIKTLSTASASRTILQPHAILALLKDTELLQPTTSRNPGDGEHNTSTTDSHQELEWLLVSKATTQAYGLTLNLLLDQTIPLSSGIGYWDQVLGSYKYLALYTIQTWPARLWHWMRDISQDAWQKLRVDEDQDAESSSFSGRWRKFYGLVQDSVRERSLTALQSSLMSPLTNRQMEVKRKRRHLNRLREMSASGLGVLMDEGMMVDNGDENSVSSKARSADDRDEWRTVVAKSVALMEAVLRHITTLEMRPSDFEETVFMNLDEEPDYSQLNASEEHSPPHHIALRLQQILETHIPAHVTASQRLVDEYGRPSRFVRYWPLGAALFLSSSTLLRIFVNRKAEIMTWISESGNTALDFWNNWVVDPARKIIGTIRHDKDSEIAIMSKDSLRGDRDSLERMVVDFAIDNPNTSDRKPLSDAQIADVRAKVKEGDLTPVLKAYEKDLRSPLRGAITGDLIRALLIQVQKTKVDVEVAVGGIDNILRSQELVFG